MPVEPRKVNKKIKRMDAFSASAPEIAILFRLKEDEKCRTGYLDPNRGCHDNNLIRLGTQYRPFSEESCEFFRDHVATSPPREPCVSRILAEHSLYETKLVMPARFDDVQHVGKTMSQIDQLFKSSHDRMLRDVAPRREDRSPIGP